MKRAGRPPPRAPRSQEFKECISGEISEKCKDLQEDYIECLHHKKEITRFNQLNAERIKKAAHGEAPKNVHEQIKEGTLKVPWTNAGS